MKTLISLMIIAIFASIVMGQQIKDPQVSVDNRAFQQASGVAPKNNADVKLKNGNPPFEFNGTDPKLDKELNSKGKVTPTGPNGTPTTVPITTPECKKCKCVPKQKIVWVKCDKTIYKKKYVPYYCYYSKHAVITGDRAAYLSKLLFKIREYRKTNTQFRLILKKLLLKQKISKGTFKKVDSIEMKKMKDLEVAIVSKKVSIQFIESQIEKIQKYNEKIGLFGI